MAADRDVGRTLGRGWNTKHKSNERVRQGDVRI